MELYLIPTEYEIQINLIKAEFSKYFPEGTIRFFPEENNFKFMKKWPGTKFDLIIDPLELDNMFKLKERFRPLVKTKNT